MSNITITYRDGFSAEDFLTLANRVWQRPFDAVAVAQALTRTTNVGAWAGPRLVGTVRVLTDGYLLSTVPELQVDPEYRRQGIGRRLMELALERAPGGALFFGAQPQSVAFFDAIDCTRGPVGFVMRRRG